MKTLVEKVDISITTIKNSLPQEKPVAGKFQISEDCTVAMFKEEENATVIIGKGKSKRIMQGRRCAVYWNPEKERFKICISVPPTRAAAVVAECDFEECMKAISRRMNEFIVDLRRAKAS